MSLALAVDEIGTLSQLIPAELGNRIRNRARKSTALKLDNYIELRDFIAENEERILVDGRMAFYEECGNWMDYSGETVRKYLTIIRNYPDDKLREWIKNGLSFDHIERANELQNVKECRYDAAHLLDAAFQFGGADGKRMTVTEMETFALGEKDRTGGANRFFGNLFTRLLNFTAKLGWDAEKTNRFKARIEEVRQEFSL